MGTPPFLISLLLLFSLSPPLSVSGNPELTALMELKASLDPQNARLTSWTVSGDPCGGSFEGVACNDKGQVATLSLQGKRLSGDLSPAIGGLKHLTVLQLCYNQFTGSIPTQLGYLKKLTVLAMQSNQFTGAIPASLGDLGMLTRLDLSFNRLFGSIPTRLADAPLLEVLDVQNNTLSGNVPPALKRLAEGFQYKNNPGLCGVGYSALRDCSTLSDVIPNMPEPYGAGSPGLATRDIPETANVKLNCSQTRCSNSSKTPEASVVVAVIVVTIALSAMGILTFSQYRRRKQKLGSSCDISDNRVSTDQSVEGYRKNGSPLISLEYSNGWDPLADGRNLGGFSQEALQSFRFNLEEVESATQYFARKNLLGRSNFSAIYKGVLRDGSIVAIKSITKSSCKSEEAEFLKGLNILTSLRHENLVRLRGFCSSRGRGECFLIYDFIPNGNLLCYLDLKEGDNRVLEWNTRVSIIKGIAKGIEYLHGCTTSKPAVVHQNISAEKVLIDMRFKPLLSDAGTHKLLTNDTVFSALKACAAMGYLAPEYTDTGRFTEKSDIYAFGVLILQILSGKRKITSSIRVAAESCRLPDFIDKNLNGRFSEFEAAKIAKVSLMCTHESPEKRPSMEAIIQDLADFTSCS
ncbi:hypothetical protein RHGRI_008385 [Rhododendron griersonianum]|uniref:Protein kinase domain-containing protein n=1 Tax=Rhododendron griersonianum TaxID=479676 RepID=A0AAV6L054_9ERIC|nr:hypothetical protein RHGRI_008385 [Rhododendron griersonianum]